MRTSADHILTSHVGSLPRPDDLLDTNRAREAGEATDEQGFQEKLRKETDKFNAKIVNGIDRKQLEAASDALLAMKHNLLAMSDGTQTDSVEDEEEDVQRSKTRKKRRVAA